MREPRWPNEHICIKELAELDRLRAEWSRLHDRGMSEPKDNAEYLRKWAADIRKHNGKSVDADHCDAMAAELDRLRAEVERCRVQCWKLTALEQLREKTQRLQGDLSHLQECHAVVKADCEKLAAGNERLREALREVNENLPGSCTDEKSWLAECLMDVREIISDALASTAPKTEETA